MVTLFMFMMCATVAGTIVWLQGRAERRQVANHGIPARSRRIRY